jgi:hypothetical protein
LCNQSVDQNDLIKNGWMRYLARKCVFGCKKPIL